MDLSLFMMPLHDLAKPYQQQLREDIEAFVLADELGYAEAWCGEHYSSSTEPITSPMMFFANLIGRTKQIKFATGVTCLPQYHPAQVAGQAAMFDHLSQGRFIFGIGTGGLQSDFELFETDKKDRAAMLRESIEMILAIWAGKPPYDIQGKYWRTVIKEWAMDDVGLGHMTKPLQQPHPPIAVTASSPNSGSLKGAGRKGWIPVSANFTPVWALKTHWEVYEAEARKAGHAVTRDSWRVARSVFVAETDAEAERFVKTEGGSFDYYYRYLHTLWSRGGILKTYLPREGMSEEETTPQVLRDTCTIWGSPQTVARKVLALREEVGHFGNLLMVGHDWTDAEAFRRSMSLMAKQAMPAVNTAIASRAAAE